MFAASRATDAVVLLAAVIGVLIVAAGLGAFDPRVRSRLPLPSAVRDRAVGRVALVIVGLVLVSVALG